MEAIAQRLDKVPSTTTVALQPPIPAPLPSTTPPPPPPLPSMTPPPPPPIPSPDIVEFIDSLPDDIDSTIDSLTDSEAPRTSTPTLTPTRPQHQLGSSHPSSSHPSSSHPSSYTSLQASSNPSLLYPSSYPFYPPPKLHHYSAHQVPRQFLTPPDQLTACCHN